MRRQPVPPENVRVVYADGRVVPVELVYTGVDDEGLHVWVPVIELGERPHRILADVVPGRTTITIRARREAW